MNHHSTFVAIMAVLFLTLTAIFNFLPRSTFSQLERRELAAFPDFTKEKLSSGDFAKEIAAWYSDTEPYRDHFMTLNHYIKSLTSIANPLVSDEEAVTYHAASAPAAAEEPTESLAPGTKDIKDYTNTVTAEANAKIADAGIIVVGKAPNARALMAYGGSPTSAQHFAKVVNKYQQIFGDQITIYVMPIPNAIEYYCPDKVKSRTKSQLATIRNIYNSVDDAVVTVDAYTPLAEHVTEDIYLRTDHHWAPLGAYYAAQAFAKEAKVPFEDLANYDAHTIHRFVGSMYGYSKDIAVKNSPEDFVYYTPRNVQYTTTYIPYTISKDYKVTGEGKPHTGEYFYQFKDGSGLAYSTFMGGDTKITQVRTDVGNGRRLVIFKDSFGNAIPSYLFHSFEEIHVIDCRYFTKNFKKYAADNKITDILFATSVFMCCNPSRSSAYERFLTQ